MDEVFDDPEAREAEALAFKAEQAERTGDMSTARGMYADAARLDLGVALRTSGRPRTRSVLAIEAVCLFARATHFDSAIDAAKRLLAEPEALSGQGVTELRKLLREYTATAAIAPSPRREDPLLVVRNQLRHQAQEAA